MPERQPPVDLSRLSFAEITDAIANRRLPPVKSWNPTHCGRSGMRIDHEGRWWHDGRRIARPEMVRLFASVLRREADGSHVLVTPVEKLDIEVEFVPLRVTAMHRESIGHDARIAFALNRGDGVILGSGVLLHMRDDVPVVDVGEGIEASFERPVYFELAELALAHDPPGLWSNGRFFPLGENP